MDHRPSISNWFLMPGDFSETQKLSQSATGEDRQKLLADFFMRHRNRLRRMVDLRLDHRLKPRIDPSDVLQETYLEASRQLDRYLRDPAVPVFIWLRAIAGQRLQKLHRLHLGTKARDIRREVSLQGYSGSEASAEMLSSWLVRKGSSPSEAAIHEERRLRLQAALEKMEPLDREVLALRHFEKLSSSETAHALGIQDAAARKRYARALDKLKDVLTRMEPKKGKGGP